MDYIKFCEELCIPKKTVKRYPNDKPWFDLSVRTDFLAKEHAFRSGDASAIKKSQIPCSKGNPIQEAIQDELAVTYLFSRSLLFRFAAFPLSVHRIDKRTRPKQCKNKTYS